MKTPYIIGITGGSASGKTLFIKTLMKHFNDGEVCLISQDEYYKKIEFQPLDEKGIANFDTPFSIDNEQLAKDLQDLKNNKVVHKEEYTFNNPALTPRIITYQPAPVIIIEGVFVFYHPDIANQLDLKIFLDAKEFVKLKRRITRDQSERGYSIEDVLYRYEYHVSPTYEKYIEPFRHEADLVIPNNNGFEKGLEVVLSFIKLKAGSKSS
jgi:uridine kinase